MKPEIVGILLYSVHIQGQWKLSLIDHPIDMFPVIYLSCTWNSVKWLQRKNHSVDGPNIDCQGKRNILKYSLTNVNAPFPGHLSLLLSTSLLHSLLLRTTDYAMTHFDKAPKWQFSGNHNNSNLLLNKSGDDLLLIPPWLC